MNLPTTSLSLSPQPPVHPEALLAPAIAGGLIGPVGAVRWDRERRNVPVEGDAIVPPFIDQVSAASVFVTAPPNQWGDASYFVQHNGLGSSLKILLEDQAPDLPTILRVLEDVPISLAVGGDYDLMVQDQPGYLRAHVESAHYSLGWMCALKGDHGHPRMASRRYLEHAGWRVIRRPGDLTVVQFHPLNVAVDEAARIATPLHVRFLNTAGAFMPRPFKATGSLSGEYAVGARRWSIAVAEGLDKKTMVAACSARAAQALGPDKPIDHVAFVFVDPAQAHAQLHELWLRSLQCWTFQGHQEVRLDQDYSPEPPPAPDWVKRLQDRDGF